MNSIDVEIFRAFAHGTRALIGRGLDELALELLRDDPKWLNALWQFRKLGKMDVPLADVRHMVALGLISADQDGFYLSDVIEEVIDAVIGKMESVP